MFEVKNKDTAVNDTEKKTTAENTVILDEELKKKNEEAKKIKFVKPKPKEKEDEAPNLKFGIVTIVMAAGFILNYNILFITSIIGLVCGVIAVVRGEKHRVVIYLAMILCTSDIAITIYSLLGYLGIISIS